LSCSLLSQQPIKSAKPLNFDAKPTPNIYPAGPACPACPVDIFQSTGVDSLPNQPGWTYSSPLELILFLINWDGYILNHWGETSSVSPGLAP